MQADSELLSHWRAGNAAAGEALFARHFDSLYRFFRSKCGHDADELVQATLLACVDARDRFRGESTFRTYLFVIARQKLHRFFATHPRFDPLESSVADITTSVRTVIARDERAEQLATALRTLPVDLQTLLELHYWEGLDQHALSEVFAVPPGTIRVWMHRARAKLRSVLES